MSVLILGIGHPFRGDDGIGPLVAERIAALSLPHVTALAHHGEGADLMERWAGFDRVVVVDATRSDAPPGTIRRWDAVAEKLPAALFPKSSHLFGLAEAVEMARLLGRLPPALTVIGVEGKDFSAGVGVSPEVAAVVERITLMTRMDTDKHG
ncbi:MAG: hydrogenase maturation protease [Bacteroidota bacterium]